MVFLRVFDVEGSKIFDYMQEELDVAQGQAFDKWNVPINSWVVAQK